VNTHDLGLVDDVTLVPDLLLYLESAAFCKTAKLCILMAERTRGSG